MSTETFQIPIEIAEQYEATFVPALFAEWASQLLDTAEPRPGQRVLDVACGTGIVARGAADRMGGAGHVVGVDLNPAMLKVAARIRPDIEWRQGDVATLPVRDASFDLAYCQAALMFFPDREAALREMRRVVAPHGTVAVLVPGRLEASTGYVRFNEVVARHAGPEAGELLRGYFVLGDLDEFTGLFRAAGLRVMATRTLLGAVRRRSVDEFVTTEVSSTPLIETLSEDAYRRVLEDSRTALAEFHADGDGVAVPIESHIVVACPV